MLLPYDRDLQTPQGILEWIQELGVVLDIRDIDGYPSRPLLFSEYRIEPPTIVIFRYLPMEDWLNTMSQQQVGYFGPWYFLPIVQRLYEHLELNGLFEIERRWHHRLFGRLSTLEERACRFTQDFLNTLHPPSKFDETVERSFRPGAGNRR